MNPPDDNALDEIQRQIVIHETLAARWKTLLQHKLDPAGPAAWVAHTSEPCGPPLPNVDGPATADRPCEPSPHARDLPLPARRGPKWNDMVRQPRAVSQQEHRAPSMSRVGSTRSDQGPSVPQRFGGVSLDVRLLPRGSPASQPLPIVQEDDDLPDVGITPDEYLAKRSFKNENSYLAMTRTDLSPTVAYSNLVPSDCPSIVSGSSALDLSQPLTRHSSSFDSHPGANMMRYFSSQSWQTDASAGADGRLCPAAPLKRSACDQDFFGVGARFPKDVGYPPSVPVPNVCSAAPSMERSASNVSDASARSAGSSLEQRSKRAFQRVRQNSDRNLILPKPHKTPADRSHYSIAPVKRDGKLALQKTPYQRPKHPRVYCTQCDEHPDGFRGDHELRRHLKAKHEGVVRKFVCRDPASLGIQTKVKALYPLSECRACTSRKKYGAYYNAAAHLRRTHFKPRAPRGKNKSPSDERRGGKGGGDWPPMADLKLWYEEVLVTGEVDTPDDNLDMMDDDSFEHCQDVPMDSFSERSAAFEADNTYGLPGPSTAETSGLSASSAQGALAIGYLDFGQMAVAPTLDPSMAAHFPESSSQIVSDYLWPMEDVEGPAYA